MHTETSREYAQRRANETRTAYLIYVYPDGEERGACMDCRRNRRVLREIGLAWCRVSPATRPPLTPSEN